MEDYSNFHPSSYNEAPLGVSNLFQDRLAESVEKLVRQQVESLLNNRRENHQRLAGTEKLELFDPGNVNCNVDRWILRCDNLGEEYGWSDFEKIILLKNKLTGRAREWYIELDAQYPDLTWNEWKKELWKTFNNHQSLLSERDYGADLEELVARRKTPNESMAMYFHDKVELCEKCGIGEAKAVSCIIRGLPEKVRPQVHQLKCPTPEALLLAFIDLFDHPIKEERKRLRFSPPPENNYDGIPVNETPAQSDSEPVTNRQCFKCKTNGHLWKHCPHRAKQETGPAIIKCFTCNANGHFRKHCPQRAKKGTGSVNQGEFQGIKVKLEPRTGSKRAARSANWRQRKQQKQLPDEEPYTFG